MSRIGPQSRPSKRRSGTLKRSRQQSPFVLNTKSYHARRRSLNDTWGHPGGSTGVELSFNEVRKKSKTPSKSDLGRIRLVSFGSINVDITAVPWQPKSSTSSGQVHAERRQGRQRPWR